MKISRHILLFLIVLPVASASFAQAYRCKTPSGGTVFSDAPCTGGSVTDKSVVDMAPSRYGNYGNSDGAQRNRSALDAKVAEAIGSGDLARARGLAVTPEHWRMISDAEQRMSARPTGRTSADLRAELRDSQECRDAQRNYNIEAGTTVGRNQAKIDSYQRSMYAACGMDEPTSVRQTNIYYR